MAACDKGLRALEYTFSRWLLVNQSWQKDVLPASTAPHNNTPQNVTTTFPNIKHTDATCIYLALFFLSSFSGPISFLASSNPGLSNQDKIHDKMSRKSRYDEDLRRLPDGMKRVGYNSSSQRYTFQDQDDGSFWEGPEGARYGELTQIRADQVETDTPIEDLFIKNTGRSRTSSTLSTATMVADVPPPTNFKDILKEVDSKGDSSRSGKISNATTLSCSGGSRGLSQRWKGALGFASAVSLSLVFSSFFVRMYVWGGLMRIISFSCFGACRCVITGFRFLRAKLLAGGAKKESYEKPLLKEVESRVEERLRSERAPRESNCNPWI
ncbi:LysM-domain-containing protein [Venturia nashicola]|nr:LysM-domain-containing protein [Venturia nashicola]